MTATSAPAKKKLSPRKRAQRMRWINYAVLAVVVVLLVRLARSGAPRPVLHRAQALLVVIVAQGAIGYTQYEMGIPPWLVALHIAGATAVLGVTVWFHLGLSAPVAARAGIDGDGLDPVRTDGADGTVDRAGSSSSA